eukprot:TRINITY_DN14214_c0_g1_i1.p1 TRINITY_DN14214_c0_g1~~TRINITY_DN14214_c0_g1_i1.p1  ORF type:complete len:1305 (-),score=298.96 TRINITY_DN14214_c0_g1_i1:107-4021(-)
MAAQRPRLAQSPLSLSCTSLNAGGGVLSARGAQPSASSSSSGLLQHSSLFRQRELKPVLRSGLPLSSASSPRSSGTTGAASAANTPGGAAEGPLTGATPGRPPLGGGKYRRSTGGPGSQTSREDGHAQRAGRRSSPCPSTSPVRNRARVPGGGGRPSTGAPQRRRADPDARQKAPPSSVSSLPTSAASSAAAGAWRGGYAGDAGEKSELPSSTQPATPQAATPAATTPQPSAAAHEADLNACLPGRAERYEGEEKASAPAALAESADARAEGDSAAAPAHAEVAARRLQRQAGDDRLELRQAPKEAEEALPAHAEREAAAEAAGGDASAAAEHAAEHHAAQQAQKLQRNAIRGELALEAIASFLGDNGLDEAAALLRLGPRATSSGGSSSSCSRGNLGSTGFVHAVQSLGNVLERIADDQCMSAVDPHLASGEVSMHDVLGRLVAESRHESVFERGPQAAPPPPWKVRAEAFEAEAQLLGDQQEQTQEAAAAAADSSNELYAAGVLQADAVACDGNDAQAMSSEPSKPASSAHYVRMARGYPEGFVDDMRDEYRDEYDPGFRIRELTEAELLAEMPVPGAAAQRDHVGTHAAVDVELTARPDPATGSFSAPTSCQDQQNDEGNDGGVAVATEGDDELQEATLPAAAEAKVEEGNSSAGLNGDVITAADGDDDATRASSKKGLLKSVTDGLRGLVAGGSKNAEEDGASKAPAIATFGADAPVDVCTSNGAGAGAEPLPEFGSRAGAPGATGSLAAQAYAAIAADETQAQAALNAAAAASSTMAGGDIADGLDEASPAVIWPGAKAAEVAGVAHGYPQIYGFPPEATGAYGGAHVVAQQPPLDQQAAAAAAVVCAYPAELPQDADGSLSQALMEAAAQQQAILAAQQQEQLRQQQAAALAAQQAAADAMAAMPHALPPKRKSRRCGPRPPFRYAASKDPFYPVEFDGITYDSFPLRIIYERDCTGFEESKEFPIRINSIIAARYQVLAYLGSAAFSRAVQCLDLETNTMVCIKIIKNDKDFMDQSLDEIKLLKLIGANTANVDEKHCLRLLDCFYHKEHLLIVTELLRDNLYEFSKFNQECGAEPFFTLGRLQKITKQVLEALEYIHSLWLIHADLKPENILVKSYSRCEVKVIDFGSSCFVDDHLSSYVQSRSYRAPEVMLGLPYDQKIDVWSLGCIVAELWTGYVLFQNDCVQSLLARILGIVGPFPEHMLTKGKLVPKFFTQDYRLYREIEEQIPARPGEIPERRFLVYLPKVSSLRQRMRTTDEVFLAFLESVLTLDPARRPSSAELLRHPWLTPGMYPDGL